MRNTLLCFVLSCLGYSLCYSTGKSCGDCISYKSCSSAVTLVTRRDPSDDQKLKNAFCGFGPDNLPKVCCSELAPAETSGDEGVENHPNLSLLPDVCGKIQGDKIIGGRSAGLYEFPWMVLVSYNTRLGPQFECGGSLINDRYVLTAAHCIVNLKLAGVRIGEIDVRTETDCQGDPPNLTCESNIQDKSIAEAIPHPQYKGKPKVSNDIGLIRLKKPVNFSFKNAGAVCLPITRELQNKDIGGENATVAGWGYTETGYVSPFLLAVDVPVHTKESCRDLYNRGNKPGDADETVKKICAGKNGKDSCGGDSGGPLMVKGAYRNIHRYIQHGIVSYGPKLCGSNFPGVYTDVSKYMKWILDNIKP